MRGTARQQGPGAVQAVVAMSSRGGPGSAPAMSQRAEKPSLLVPDAFKNPEYVHFAVRGALIDIFPMGSAEPYRIELFDDEVESIRSFDAETQRSQQQVERIELLPAREFPADDAARTAFRVRFREKFEGDPSKSRLYKDVSQGFWPAGIEYYLPLWTALVPHAAVDEQGFGLAFVRQPLVFIEHSQDNAPMSQAARRLDEAIRNGWLVHDGNPKLRTHALNAVEHSLSGEKWKYDRPKEKQGRARVTCPIDALTCLLFGHNVAVGEHDEPEQEPPTDFLGYRMEHV